jgi:hypothetical protein
VLFRSLYGWFFFQHGQFARVVASWSGVIPFLESIGCCFFGAIGGILCLFAFSLTTFGVESADYLIGQWYSNVTGGQPTLALPELNFTGLTAGLIGGAPLGSLSLLDHNSLKFVDTVTKANAKKVGSVENALGVTLEGFLPLGAFAGQIRNAFKSVKDQGTTVPGAVTDNLGAANTYYTDSEPLTSVPRTIGEFFGDQALPGTVNNANPSGCASDNDRANLVQLQQLCAQMVAAFDTVSTLPAAPTNLNTGLGVLKETLLAKYEPIVGAVCAFVEAINPAAKALDVGVLVGILNWFQNVFLWGFGFWGGCVSIAGYFGTLGLVVVVLELWLRRVGMMRHSELTVKTTYSYSDEADVPT